MVCGVMERLRSGEGRVTLWKAVKVLGEVNKKKYRDWGGVSDRNKDGKALGDGPGGGG